MSAGEKFKRCILILCLLLLAIYPEISEAEEATRFRIKQRPKPFLPEKPIIIKPQKPFPLPVKFDIAVKDISLDEQCYVRILYENTGTAEITTSLKQSLWIGDKRMPDQIIPLKTIRFLPGKRYIHHTEFRLNKPSQRVRVIIDVDNILREANEQNNTLTRILYCKTLHEPKIIYFKPEPESINWGSRVSISWKVDNATSVELVDPQGRRTRVGKIGSRVVSPKTTSEYELIARKGEVETRKKIQVFVKPSIAEFFASEDKITEGETVRIHYKVFGADRIRLVPDNIEKSSGGRDIIAGFYDVSPASTTEYTLIAESKGRTNSATLTITVVPVPPPEASEKPRIKRFFVEPEKIMYGEKAKLYWEVEGADYVEILPNIGRVGSSGEYEISPGQTTKYTLYAKNSAGTASSFSEIRVITTPFYIRTKKLMATGIIFKPIKILTKKLEATGKIFAPVVVKTEKLMATGIIFRPVKILTKKLEATGKIFPIKIRTEKLEATGKKFTSIIIKTEKLTATGKR